MEMKERKNNKNKQVLVPDISGKTSKKLPNLIPAIYYQENNAKIENNQKNKKTIIRLPSIKNSSFNNTSTLKYQDNRSNSSDYRAIREKSKGQKNRNIILNTIKEINYFPSPKDIDIPKMKKYLILQGNNSGLIKLCMKHRINWKKSTDRNPEYHFKWKANSKDIDFTSLNKKHNQLVNHFENHTEISNKLNLFINMINYCESQKENVFKYLPFTIIIQNDTKIYQKQFSSFTNLFNNIQNYLPNNENFQKKYPKYSKFFPFLDQGNKIGKKTKVIVNNNHFNNKNIWLVKAPDLNRGRCIRIADSLARIEKLIKKFFDGIYRGFKRCEKDEIKENIEEEEEHEEEENNEKNALNNDLKKKPEKDSFRKYRTSVVLIQKYLEKPLLYWGRKFDIRMWVMINNKMDVYVFKEGHLKTSSLNYDINTIDSFVHLTNYSVQKYNGDFSKFEKGNEVSFKEFQDYLDKEYHGKYKVNEDLIKKICDLIKISLNSVKERINPHKHKSCFEIFGFDFIMDYEFNLYLLEINTNPGLEYSSPLIKTLLPRMIDDALRLTIDVLFDTRYSFQDKLKEIKDLEYLSPFPVENYSNSENLFLFICNIS